MTFLLAQGDTIYIVFVVVVVVVVVVFSEKSPSLAVKARNHLCG